MANHQLYGCIVEAIKKGKLKEPFTAKDVEQICPHNYKTFLSKHRRGNPRPESQLFERVRRGQYKLLRPTKYGLDC
jgi:hypothetical protein